MFHVKRFMWNNRKSSAIIEPAIDIYEDCERTEYEITRYQRNKIPFDSNIIYIE